MFFLTKRLYICIINCKIEFLQSMDDFLSINGANKSRDD